MRHGRVNHLEYSGDPTQTYVLVLIAMFIKVTPLVPVFFLYLNSIHTLRFVKNENLRMSEYYRVI